MKLDGTYRRDGDSADILSDRWTTTTTYVKVVEITVETSLFGGGEEEKGMLLV